METAFTLDSFKTILSDNYYYSIMWRTIKMALLATFITLFCAYPVAETMARTKGGKKISICHCIGISNDAGKRYTLYGLDGAFKQIRFSQ